MDVQRTIEFILQQQAKTEAILAENAEQLKEMREHQKKTDRDVKIIAGLVKLGMKMLIEDRKQIRELRQEQLEMRREWAEMRRDFNRDLKALMQAQAQTDRKLDRLIDTMLDKNTNGRRRSPR